MLNFKFFAYLCFLIILLSAAPFLKAETYTDRYDYTGSSQQWIVPGGVYSVNFQIAGARGQNSNEAAGYGGGTSSPGGKGGLVSGELQVTPGETLFINIGGTAGWNGGGNGGARYFLPNLFSVGGKGGGGSDIRIGTNDVDQRVVVGGGGGGGLTSYWAGTPVDVYAGAAGGYPAGGNAPYVSHWYPSSVGGSQASGCALFQGCNGPYWEVWGAGGGGGYYGGGAKRGSSGGGGSSYFNPDLTANVSYENGANGGNGYLVLTYESNQLGSTTVNTAEFDAFEEQSLSATLIFDDPNGLVSFNLSSQPANGVLTVDDSLESPTFSQLTVPFEYTPNQSYTGTDYFTLTLTDSLSANTAITFTIDVLADADGDGIGDLADPDDDNDGTEDSSDAFPFDPSESSDSDGDGIGDNTDIDDDNDGVNDLEDALPFDSSETLDTDSDGQGNNSDTDDDNDGVEDEQDTFPLDSNETMDTDGDGIGNNADADDDNDGYLDVGTGDYYEATNVSISLLPKSTTTDFVAGEELIGGLDDFNLFDFRLSGHQPFEFTDQYSGVDYRFISVIFEQGGISTIASPIDASEDTPLVPIRFELDSAMTLEEFTSMAFNGGDLSFFSIQKGEQIDIDAFPLDPSEWQDTDGDGVGDNSDAFPDDPSETVDTDGDGVGDNADAFPNDPAETTDSDSDGVGDNTDAFPEDASETVDSDGDGIGNNADQDDDNDGYQDYATAAFYEGIADYIYFSAKDSITSLPPGTQLIWWLSDFNMFDMRYMGFQEFEFNDNDGGPSYRFTSVIVQQGVITARATAINTEIGASELVIKLYPDMAFTDQELLAAVLDDDELGSFSIEVAEAADVIVDVFPLDPSEWFDTDDDGIGNNADTDDDGDGVADTEDTFPLDSSEIMDTDGDGIGNNADLDDDGDGIPDRVDLTPLGGNSGSHKLMDIDANGDVDPLTDGMIVLRYMFGFSGEALVDGALGENATRTDPVEIEAHLESIINSY